MIWKNHPKVTHSNDQPISFATTRYIIFSQPSYFLVAAFWQAKYLFSRPKVQMVSFTRYLFLYMPEMLRGSDKLWRLGQGSARGTSKAEILWTSHNWNALVQVAALKQLLLAGPCLTPHMLVQNDHPLSDYNSQTFQLFNIETSVQDTTCTWWCTISGTFSTCACTYTCTSTWECAGAPCACTCTYTWQIGSAQGHLALLLALALGRAHGQAPGQNGSCDPTAR